VVVVGRAGAGAHVDDVYHVAEVAGFDHDISALMLICCCRW
jgi:hypothetical protein